MTAKHWQQVEAILQDALDIEAGAARARFVAEACADDAELRQVIERLIAADENANSFIESPVWTDSQILAGVDHSGLKMQPDKHLLGGSEHAAEFANDAADKLIGTRIGVFELEKELGRGGMGAVFLAGRVDGEFRQKVAVKLIKRGMDTDFIVKRFRHERQILAALNHPNIARLIDGGTTSDDLPYFVMEYVAGEPLYRFCDKRKLNTTERLRLFGRLCEAVEAAHQIKVVHRDLKPSNILVKADGTPKLLDFGIAKILDPDLASATLEPTATMMRMMTPEYASPEQVSGLPITFASDIYSLGVLLYELLTGHRPYRFKSRASHEIARVICEEEPLRLSTGVTLEDNLLPTGASEATTLSDVFLFRGAPDIESLQKELSGEIEKVVLKCLRKNPVERYQSAADLTADIARFLDGEPVRAEALTPTIESKKTQTTLLPNNKVWFRNPGHKFAPTLIFTILMCGALAVFGVFQLTKDNPQSESQTQQFSKRSVAILPFRNETADAENDFLCDGLSENLINRLSYLPEIKVAPRSAVVKYKKAQAAAQQIGKEMNVAVVLAGTLAKSNDKIAIFLELIDVSDGSLIRSFQYNGKESELVFLQNKMASDVAAQFKPVRTTDQKQIVSRGFTENSEAFEFYLKGEFERQKFTAESNRKSIEHYRRALELDANYALAYQGLALACRMAPAFRTLEPQEAYPQAKEAALKALAIDPTLGTVYLPLASIKFAYDWDFAGAESEYRQAIELAPNNPEIHSSYATFLTAMGRHDEALNESKIARRLDSESSNSAAVIGWTLYVAGRFDEAEAHLSEIIKLNPSYARAYINLGEIYLETGRFDQALEALQKAGQLSPDAQTETIAASVYAASGRTAEASELAASLEAKAQKKEIPAFLMAEVYAGLRDSDKAFDWLERAVDERSNWLVFAKVSPRLKPLRNDARYQDLLKRIGFDNRNARN